MKAKYLTIICTTFALAVTGSVALAQTSTETKTPEIELSPEGFKILCERFPLNSRCPGGTTSSTTPSTGTSDTTTTPESSPSPNPTAPDPATPETTAPGTSETPPPTDSTSPGVPGGAGDTINNPSNPSVDPSSGTTTTPSDPTNPGVPDGVVPEGSAPPTTAPAPAPAP